MNRNRSVKRMELISPIRDVVVVKHILKTNKRKKKTINPESSYPD